MPPLAGWVQTRRREGAAASGGMFTDKQGWGGCHLWYGGCGQAGMGRFDLRRAGWRQDVGARLPPLIWWVCPRWGGDGAAFFEHDGDTVGGKSWTSRLVGAIKARGGCCHQWQASCRPTSGGGLLPLVGWVQARLDAGAATLGGLDGEKVRGGGLLPLFWSAWRKDAGVGVTSGGHNGDKVAGENPTSGLLGVCEWEEDWRHRSQV